LRASPGRRGARDLDVVFREAAQDLRAVGLTAGRRVEERLELLHLGDHERPYAWRLHAATEIARANEDRARGRWSCERRRRTVVDAKILRRRLSDDERLRRRRELRLRRTAASKTR
jgi:hypothetical protein